MYRQRQLLGVVVFLCLVQYDFKKVVTLCKEFVIPNEV